MGQGAVPTLGVPAGGRLGCEQGVARGSEEGICRREASALVRGKRIRGVGGEGHSDADGGQSAARLVGEGAQGAGDIGEAVQAGEGDGEVAQAGHDRRPVADADARAILVEGHVTHVVGAVLDAPVAAVEAQQPVRVGLLGWQAGHGEDDLVALGAGLELGDGALDAADLGDMGKGHIVVQGGGGEQAALLQTSVALIEGGGAVGENAPRRGR